jgi:hypothetical protein
MSIFLAKLLYNAINESGLGQMDGVGGEITRYGDSKGMFNRAKVGYFPLAFQLITEPFCFGNGRGGRDDVVDMQNKDCGTGGHFVVINTPFTGQVNEVPPPHGLIEC